MNKKLYLFFLLFFTQKIYAQNLTSFIPSTTPYVFGINLANIEAKSNQQDYAKFLAKMIKPTNYYYTKNDNSCDLISLEQIIKNPVSFGIDNKTDIYLYTVDKDQASGKTYLFKLTDANLFESKITKECNDTLSIESKMTDRGKVYVSDDMAICINGNIGTIFVKNYIYNYYGGYNSYNDNQYNDEKLWVEPAIEDSTAMYMSEDVIINYDSIAAALTDSAYHASDNDTYISEDVIIEAPSDNVLPPPPPPLPPGIEEPMIIEERPVEEIGTGTWEEPPVIMEQTDDYGIVEAIPPSAGNDYYSEENNKKRRIEERKAQHQLMFDFVYENVIFQVPAIQDNKGFQKITAEKHDAFVYLNTLGMFGKKGYNPFHWGGIFNQDDATLVSDANKLLTEDINSGYSIDFENGKAIVKMTNNFNENIYPYYKKIYAKKQSKDLYKYIEGKNLLGYVSVAADIKESARLYEDIMKEMAGNLKFKKRDSYILPTMELMYAFIDKEMLYGTFSGQMLYACTGFKDVHVKYTTYEYDEDYNRVSKEVDTTQKQPKMVLASGIGNYDNARKLFDIISKFDVFTKLNNNVISVGGDRKIPFTMFIALTKDALIITNDADLVLSNLNGLPKSEQISKEDRKSIGNHNIAVKIYAEKTLKGINDSYFKNGETLPMFSQLMTSLGDLEMYDEKLEKTSGTSTAVLTLKDNSSNALYQLLQLMSAAK